MAFITNPIFSERERVHLEFVLQHEFPERCLVVGQLNQMKEQDVLRDITPYYWIMEFRPNCVKPGYGPMRPCIDIEVLHGNNTAPTEFTLYIRNGIVFELEIYNADSSEMNLESIMDGEVYIHTNT